MDEQQQPTPIVDLVCPPQASMLGLIRSIVATVSREVGFPPEEASLIEISVDEACTNVIRHAYDSLQTANGEPPILRVQICPGPDCVAIRVIDRGKGIPPDGLWGVSSAEEYASQSQPKRLGMFIIRRCMDEVTSDKDSPPASGTILVMAKYLRGPKGP